MRPILIGLFGVAVTHVLIVCLGRLFPVGPKPYPLQWYARRYAWLEWLALALFLTGLGAGLWLYGSGRLSSHDPRGFAAGFTVGCLAAFAAVAAACTWSPRHRWREYWDYHELKHGARSVFALYIVVPVLAVAAYGTIHLLLMGP